MENQNEYRYDSLPYNLRSMQLPDMPSEPQNGPIEGTEDTTLSDSINEEIGQQWQHIKTSLTIIRNLHIERANMKLRGPNKEANANLIASAPDMYEACKTMMDALNKLPGGLPDSTFTEPYFKMREALTKAQGGVWNEG